MEDDSGAAREMGMREMIPSPRTLSITTVGDQQRGFALLAVLILSGLCMLMITQITYRHQLEKSANMKSLIQDQTILLALSAESWARKLLLDDVEDNQFDSLEDTWAQPLPVLPVEGGYLSGCIRDLQGRFNLNNLESYDTDSWNDELASLFSSDLDAYLNLLAILELDSSEIRAAVIVDWTDADTEALIPGSLEDAEYSLEEPSRLSANQYMVSLDELAGLPSYSSADVLKLYPYLTALPGRIPVNVNTATMELLMALSSAMDRFVVEEILLERPFETLDDFYTFVAQSTGYMSEAEMREQLPPNMISTDSEYFELLTSVNLLDQQIKMRSLIQRQGGNASVFSREFQSVPVVLSDTDDDVVSTFDCYTLIPEEDES